LGNLFRGEIEFEKVYRNTPIWEIYVEVKLNLVFMKLNFKKYSQIYLFKLNFIKTKFNFVFYIKITNLWVSYENTPIWEIYVKDEIEFGIYDIEF
jgi:hypothetical protein